MRAVGYRKSLPIEDANSLLDVEVDKPQPGEHDLLVEVKAIAVNPVDTKVRKRAEPPEGEVKILGYDAAGIVVGTGAKVKLFKAGDEVFYAGSLVRQGTNSQFHAVDERITGRKPKNLTFAQAAALPLTSITAWEMLFDRLGVKKNDASDKRSLLLVGGAGGVGSIAIQLARKLTSLTVIATASRAETIAWCRDLGAHHVIDHSKPMPEQLKALGFAHCDLVVSLTATDTHLPAMAEIVAPQGKFGLIDDPKSFDALLFKRKSVSLHWEFMFTRPMFDTPDIAAQNALLNEVSALVEAGAIRTTLSETFGTINAANLRRAHALIESGKAKGKIVLDGF
jgi:NADPH2:quinone reductase